MFSRFAFLRIGAVLITLSFLFVSCSETEQIADPPNEGESFPAPLGMITFQVGSDTLLVEADARWDEVSTLNALDVYATKALDHHVKRAITLRIYNPKHSNRKIVNGGYLNTTVTAWVALKGIEYFGTSGTVDLIYTTDSTIRGTFNFTAKKTPDLIDSVVVVNGAFDLKIY